MRIDAQGIWKGCCGTEKKKRMPLATGRDSGMGKKMKFRNVDKKRLVLVIVAVILMGYFLSYLNLTKYGTDPSICMNLGISSKLGITLGNWQALLNCILFAFVIYYDRGQLGWGTLANMFLVGYSFDFFTWLHSLWMPADLFDSLAVRIIVTAVALCLFVIVAAVYMACDLGTSPYDGLPFIISARLKLPFRIVRMCWDIGVCTIGFLFGNPPGIVTIAMAFALGPVISWMKTNVIEKYI